MTSTVAGSSGGDVQEPLFAGVPPAATDAVAVPDRLEKDRTEGLERVLRIGAIVAAVTMLIDGTVFMQTRNEAYLLFSALAALVLVAVVYGFTALRAGRIDRAVAVPIVYVLLIAPVGPMFIASRALVSVALPFIAMAVAMNYANPRYVRAYGVLSWVSAVAVLGFWQWRMMGPLGIGPAFAVTNAMTASLIVGFSLYALSRYSQRLHGAFTETREAHVELAEAHDELRQVDAARVRFMNNAAHELKTPLTPISLQMQLLKRSAAATEDERARRSVEILDRNFKRLQRLVTDIVDGARLDAGRLEVHLVPLDLSATLEEAIEEYERAAEMSGITLTGRIEPDLHVAGDPIRLRQVVDNFLSNALKFTAPGGTVTLEAVGVGKDACVSVHDRGLGLAPHDITKLFYPFRQVHDPLKTVTGGSGLGLYISKGIVERHGGRIWAESAGLGQGSTFSFCLERREVQEGQTTPRPVGARVLAARETRREATGAALPDPPMQGR